MFIGTEGAGPTLLEDSVAMFHANHGNTTGTAGDHDRCQRRCGSRLTSEEMFTVQGMRVKLEHDFGVSGIDCRGGYRNAGA